MARPYLKVILYFSSLFISISMVTWLLWFSQYGLDFSDEGFYLNWISNPFNYSISISQFGFIYNPLYFLLDENLISLRRANIIITFSLAWILSYKITKSFTADNKNIYQLITTSLAIATSSFAIFYTHTTPSYNTLNFQALLLTMIGIYSVDSQKLNTNSWIIISCGGWLAFMAKPSSAALLSLIILLYLISTKKLTGRTILILIFTTLFLVFLSALWIDKSLFVFLERITNAIMGLKILAGGHSINNLFRLDLFWPGYEFTVLFITTIIFIVITLKATLTNVKVLSIYLLSLVSILFIFNQLHFSVGRISHKGLLILALPVSLLLTFIINCCYLQSCKKHTNHFFQALLLLSFPYIFSIGSNSNYWVFGSASGIFWILACLPLIKIIEPKNNLLTILFVVLCGQFLTLVTLHDNFENPYRQPQSLYKNTSLAKIGDHKYSLILPKDTKKYLDRAYNFMHDHGFKKGSPIIDLTGQSPTLLYSLQANSIGQAWMIGGYPGSEKLAEYMLQKSSCKDLNDAWVIYEPDQPRSISPGMLNMFGLDLSLDFQLIGTFYTSKGAGGYSKPRLQKVYKPLRKKNQTAKHCIKEQY